MKWRPIETAPRDWSTLILYDGEDVFAGYYSCADGGQDCWMSEDSCDFERKTPTHWMPLPTPPAKKEN